MFLSLVFNKGKGHSPLGSNRSGHYIWLKCPHVTNPSYYYRIESHLIDVLLSTLHCSVTIRQSREQPFRLDLDITQKAPQMICCTKIQIIRKNIKVSGVSFNTARGQKQ